MENVPKLCMILSDFAKTAFLLDLKVESVTLPSFSMLVSYLEASGLESGLRKESSSVLLLIEHLGLSLNLLVELIFGLYCIMVFLP